MSRRVLIILGVLIVTLAVGLELADAALGHDDGVRTDRQ